MLINPDAIVREDTLLKMLEFFNKTPQVGIAGCKVLNPDGSLQLACRRSFPGPWTSFTKVMGLSKLFPKSRLFARYNLTYLDEYQTYEVDAVSGAFMMMRKEVYEKIGGFDQQFLCMAKILISVTGSKNPGIKFFMYITRRLYITKEKAQREAVWMRQKSFMMLCIFLSVNIFLPSFVVESILQIAILFRKLIAFANIYKLAFLSIIVDFFYFFNICSSCRKYIF